MYAIYLDLLVKTLHLLSDALRKYIPRNCYKQKNISVRTNAYF